MKKSQKCLLTTLIMIIPAFIIIVFLFISGISIKEFPLWAIIVITSLILILPLAFSLAQNSVRQTDNYSLQKQKKKLLTVWGIYIIFLTLMLIVLYYINSQSFWVIFFTQTVFLLSVFLLNYRLFFPKKKEFPEAGNRNNSGI